MTTLDEKPSVPDTETFVPTVTFTGWPNGFNKANREGVTFLAGVESIPVPAKYAALIREKGLAPEK